jgi:DNA-binding response OmpR family regulator
VAAAEPYQGVFGMNNKILLVDDEQNILDVFSEAFNGQGYEVHTAMNAREALDVLENENIQVMFLDLMLPGMNGVDLCREIRKDHPLAQIFAVTAFASLFELADCREAGFDDYFTKPVNLKLLIKTAKDAFERLERWRER